MSLPSHSAWRQTSVHLTPSHIYDSTSSSSSDPLNNNPPSLRNVLLKPRYRTAVERVLAHDPMTLGVVEAFRANWRLGDAVSAFHKTLDHFDQAHAVNMAQAREQLASVKQEGIESFKLLQDVLERLEIEQKMEPIRFPNIKRVPLHLRMLSPPPPSQSPIARRRRAPPRRRSTPLVMTPLSHAGTSGNPIVVETPPPSRPSTPIPAPAGLRGPCYSCGGLGHFKRDCPDQYCHLCRLTHYGGAKCPHATVPDAYYDPDIDYDDNFDDSAVGNMTGSPCGGNAEL